MQSESEKSINALFKLVVNVASDKCEPALAATIEAELEAIRLALHTQGKLAQLELPKLGIRRMSLNTCKRAASEYLPGGFPQLDQARRFALERLTKRAEVEAHSPRTKEGLTATLRQLQERERVLEQDLARLTDAFRFLLRCARRYATESGRAEVVLRYRADIKEAFARASLVQSNPLIVDASAQQEAAP